MTVTLPFDKVGSNVSASRIKERKVALSELLRHSAGHPIVAPRFPPMSLDQVSPETAIGILESISPASSADHLDAILQRGVFANSAALSNAGIVFSTSGTSGRPKLLINDYDEMLVNAEFHGLAYQSAGIRDSDVVATFGGTGTFASEYCVYHALSKTGCVTLPVNDYRKTTENVELLQNLKASVLLAMPSELFDIVQHLEHYGLRLQHIRLVVTDGEPLSDQLKRRLLSTMGSNLEFGSTFQSADLGTIGYQCEYCGPAQYHLQERLHYAEILKEGTVEPDTEGVLVITNLHRRRMPIVRILSGDRVRLIERDNDSCACGDHTKKVALLGRRGDLVKIGGHKIDAKNLSTLTAESGVLESDVAIIIKSSPDTGKDNICIQVRGGVPDGLRSIIERSLSQDPLLREMLTGSRIDPITFGPLESRFDGKAKNKHRALYDLRTFNELGADR